MLTNHRAKHTKKVQSYIFVQTLSMGKFIQFNLENGVAVLRLNRPDKLNSFNREMALDMQSRLDHCRKNAEIRAVVITGSGRAFSAGQDLEEATDPNGPELSRIVSEHYNPIVKRIRALEKPVIALVNGVAAGAGANIALACDVVVAAESASFIQAFSKIGLIPDSGGTYFLPRLIGMQKAAALMMIGDKIPAEEAEQMGMIYKVVPDDELETFGNQLSIRLAQMPTYGLALTKKALNESFGHSLNQQLDLEDQLQTEAGKSYDYQEGTAAFLEKRKPLFKGK